MKEFKKYVAMEIGTDCYIGIYSATRVPGGLMLNNFSENGYGETKRVNMTDTFVPFMSLRQTLENL